MNRTHSRQFGGARSAGAVATALLLAAGCQAESDPPAPAPTPPPSGSAEVRVAESTAAPGSTVSVEASGFAPSTQVQIGFGVPRSEYDVIASVTTDAQGSLARQVQVPGWAMAGQPYVVVVAAPGNDPRAVSDPFVVGSPGDEVRIHGTMTDEGVECPAVRGPAGTLYTLAGGDIDVSPGQQVMLEGTIVGAAICMQGTTVQVERLEPR